MFQRDALLAINEVVQASFYTSRVCKASSFLKVRYSLRVLICRFFRFFPFFLVFRPCLVAERGQVLQYGDPQHVLFLDSR